MARFTSPVQQPFAPLSRVAPLYLDQALMDIEKNMQAQRIYPTEVYRGYEKVNQYRKDHGMWYSTGEGAKSFEGHIYQADDQKGLLTVGIRYNDYLRYVDIGVGLTGDVHVRASDVDRTRPAKNLKRYIRGKWDRKQGKSHRPAIMRTIRRLRDRYRQYLADFYGYQGGIEIIKALEGYGEYAKYTF